MKKPLTVLAGLMALGLAGADSAGAQGLYYNGPGSYYGPRYYGPRYYAPGLAPWQVMRVVRSAGLTTIGPPARRGRSYVLSALDRNGSQVRVVVDAYEGTIVSVRPVLAMRQYRTPEPLNDPRVAIAPSYDDRAAAPDPAPGPQTSAPNVRAPLPPRSAPNQRVANAPATSGSITASPAPTARTPIPRPRPSVAANEMTTATAPTAVQAPAASPPAAAATPVEVPEAPPAPTRSRSPTRMVPVAPLD